MATILIVEDDGLIVLGLQRQLTDLGHTVLRPADSAAVALAMVRVFQPNAVFMDLQLPGDTDGLTVGGMIEAAGIPVIYLSDSPCAPPTAAHQGAAPLLLLKTPLDGGVRGQHAGVSLAIWHPPASPPGPPASGGGEPQADDHPEGPRERVRPEEPRTPWAP
jgi:CheY-like chemotaxis protein